MWQIHSTIASLSQARTSHLVCRKQWGTKPTPLLDGVSSVHIHTYIYTHAYTTGHLGKWTPVPWRPKGEFTWICRLFKGSSRVWERGCRRESHKTDRRGRGGEVIIQAGNLKVLLFRCVRQPTILGNLSVVEQCFCFGVVRCGRPELSLRWSDSADF